MDEGVQGLSAPLYFGGGRRLKEKRMKRCCCCFSVQSFRFLPPFPNPFLRDSAILIWLIPFCIFSAHRWILTNKKGGVEAVFCVVFYGRFLSISIPTMATAIIIATVEAMNIGVLSGAACGAGVAAGAAPTDRPVCPDEVQ